MEKDGCDAEEKEMTPDNLKSAIDEYIPNMEGWTTPERCIEMCDLVIETRAQCVVEIGVFAGRSLLAQAFGMRHLALGGKVYGIDPWKKEDCLEGENEANKEYWSKLDLHHIHKLAVETIWQHHLDEYAVLIQSASQNCEKLFGYATIDILNIDGCHSEIASCRDVITYLPKVRKGGFVWFDDCKWPSTEKALELMDAQCDRVKDAGEYRLYRKR